MKNCGNEKTNSDNSMLPAKVYKIKRTAKLSQAKTVDKLICGLLTPTNRKSALSYFSLLGFTPKNYGHRRN